MSEPAGIETTGSAGAGEDSRVVDVRVARWDALKPAGTEWPNSVAAASVRADLVAQLRQLADFLQARPEIPVPRHGNFTFTVFAGGTDQEKRAQVDYASMLLGTPVIDDTPAGGHYRTRLSFGRVDYDFVAIPKEPKEHIPVSFAAGQEVRFAPEVAGAFRRCGIAQAGVIISCDPGGQGESQCLVRVPGPVSMHLPGRMLEPVSFGTVATARGPVTTLAGAQAALVEAMARIKVRETRSQPPDARDVSDQRELSVTLARMCGLPRDVLLRQLDGSADAKAQEYLRAERTTIRQSRAPAARVAASDATPDGTRGSHISRVMGRMAQDRQSPRRGM